MANYYIQTVVHQTIPPACMTPLETAILTQVFQYEEEDDGSLYLFAEESPSSSIVIDQSMIDRGADGFRKAIEDSRERSPELVQAVEKVWTGEADLDVEELGGYEPIFLEIIRREKNKIEGGCFAIEQSFTCSKMRSDGFGGAMTMVTPEGVQGISTQEWLHKKLQQRDDGGVTVDLDQRELSSILAALRYMQSHMGNGDFRPDIDAIAANDNTIRPLDEDEIDALCERINCGR
jgi:hypothetical protein